MIMDKKIIIRILAGMGPKSTAPFLEKVIDEYQRQYGAQNDIDFPHILIYSLPTPFFVDKPIDHKEMKKVLLEGIKKLEHAGVSFIAIPCNSVHIYFDELQKATKIPLLNIIEETIKEVTQKTKKITLFAAQATIDSRLYQKELEKRKLKCILNKEWQQQINQSISLIKKGKKEEACMEMKRIISALDKEKIDTIIVACTDLQPLLETITTIKIIDSSSALAKAVVKKYRNL